MRAGRLRVPVVTIRAETAADVEAIGHLIEGAFRGDPYSGHTEQFIVRELRRCNRLTVSLVVLDRDDLVGHVAISPVTISSGATGWYGLGPLSVRPDHQRQGIGTRLMQTALAELQRIGAVGCVLRGDPAYYARFGFKAYKALRLWGVPPESFQALSFGPEIPKGWVSYHAAFQAKA